MLNFKQKTQKLFFLTAIFCCNSFATQIEKNEPIQKTNDYKESNPESNPVSDNKKIKYKWLNNKDCNPVIIKPLSYGFKLGLSAFKVKCQNGQERILSANVSQKLTAYQTNVIKNKNDSLSLSDIKEVDFEVFNLHKIPATEEEILSSTLKKNINEGSIIFSTDLEMPSAWINGDLIEIMSNNRNILATTKGIALENSKLNQSSKAKIGNKITSGFVKQKKDGTFFLEIK